MIELQNINVCFNKNTKLENHVLKTINLSVLDGQFVTIIGGNGAGKSTLMNILSGDITPDSGRVLIDKQDVTKLSTAQRSCFVARVFQDPMIGTFTNLTIEENMSIASKRGSQRGLALGLNHNLREWFKESLAELGMDLEKRLNDKVASLSGGQRQALSLIMATLLGSKVLLLDEHTAALDPKIGKIIMELTNKIIKKHNLTALMITHSMAQALDYGDRTIMLYHGEVIRDMQGENRTALSPDDLIKYFDL
ncbi:ABC transporter ATP-binding protein [Candidatus Trichorickettsia mobilis]|jgi:putative ABC transport system ATP-binding protein|uniref:ABC transporter ATP-binding protein n=1 Tax=Candidatus Trichorickettsia mobilis TaxID=1346319 RepID=A0ABZ0UV18_9RICK|nr:ATP-binding cassette domain-containing protein [Candidatus Trichorickettsia mobilis]WPY00833.1 ABC transporter ATP-binding protein [Candidatus Trichorickettsia mobilis]